MPSDPCPPVALTRAVEALGSLSGRRLDLVPAARPHSWSVLAYTAAGEARVFLAAQEEGALYATIRLWLEQWEPHAGALRPLQEETP